MSSDNYLSRWNNLAVNYSPVVKLSEGSFNNSETFFSMHILIWVGGGPNWNLKWHKRCLIRYIIYFVRFLQEANLNVTSLGCRKTFLTKHKRPRTANVQNLKCFLSAIKFTIVKANNVLYLYSIGKSITLHKSSMMSKCDDIGRKMGL